jgi:hypothetical protein
VPDGEMGVDSVRLTPLMNLRSRWSSAGKVANGRLLRIEVRSHANDGRADANVASDGGQPGRPVDRSLEPLPSSGSPDEHAVGSEAVAKAVGPLVTDIGELQQDSHRQEWCSIVFAGDKRQGEFRIVVLDNRGRRQVVARSSPFRVSRSGRISRRGSAKEAHDLLLHRLLALGWRPVASRGHWHDVAFTRTASCGERPVERLIIICRRDHLVARFQAARVDALGNATVVAESEQFRALHGCGSTKFAGRAEKAHRTLMQHLRADGWQPTDSIGTEWYGHVLERPAGLRSVR